MIVALAKLGPFDSILDVGSYRGDFAEFAHRTWPDARVTSFEALPRLAAEQRERARGRWAVTTAAVSSRRAAAVVHECVNQPSASTMQTPGSLRLVSFGIHDRFRDVSTTTVPLDEFFDVAVTGRLLVKVDVEGHEGEVLAGAALTLDYADVVVVEVQQEPTIFLDAPTPADVDGTLRSHGLAFAGVVGALSDRRNRIVQFDGLWTRP